MPETLKHSCWEQNLYGWLQSALNAIDPDRNLLYERLKGNRSHQANRRIALAIHALLAAILLPPAVLAEVGAILARSGATVETTFRKLS